MENLPDPGSTTETHKLRVSRVFAAILSSIFPGLGQVLLGKTRAGFGFFCAYGVLAAFYWPFRLPQFYFGMLVVIFVSMGLFISGGWHALRTPSQKNVPRSRWWLLLLVPLAYNASFWSDTLLLTLAGFRAFDVPSRSMEPTILAGDRIVTNLADFRKSKLKPNDIVVIQKWGTFSVKRVVATGGVTVEGKDDLIVVNGRPLNEPYVEHIGDVLGLHLNVKQFGPVTVGPDELFVLGDNRDNTIDSRSPDFGSVTEDEVAGKVLYIVRHPKWWRIGLDFIQNALSLVRPLDRD